MFDTFPAPAHSTSPVAASVEPPRCAVFLGEPTPCGRLWRACEDLGLAAVHAADIGDVQRRLGSDRIALIVLTPLTGGQIDYSACHELSRLRATPLLVFSDRDSPTDRILALELGADDWIAATCCDRELAARLKAAMRRTHMPSTTESDEVRIGGWRLNRRTGESRHDHGARAILSRSETIILNLFVRNIGAVIGRADIHQALGGDADTESAGITVHVFRLRRKLAAGSEELIRTIRGVGYVMDGPVSGL